MGDAEFKHITVTAADEDDFVIRAGVEAAPAPAGGDTSEEARASAPTPEPESEPTPVPAPEPGHAPVGARTSAPEPKPASKKADDYHETTLEDLNSEPMPMAQKIVIAAAIVCIIGAIVYYFVFMR